MTCQLALVAAGISSAPNCRRCFMCFICFIFRGYQFNDHFKAILICFCIYRILVTGLPIQLCFLLQKKYECQQERKKARNYYILSDSFESDVCDET